MSNVSGKELALEVCKALADKRGKDIVVLDVRGKTDLCDFVKQLNIHIFIPLIYSDCSLQIPS